MSASVFFSSLTKLQPNITTGKCLRHLLILRKLFLLGNSQEGNRPILLPDRVLQLHPHLTVVTCQWLDFTIGLCISLTKLQVCHFGGWELWGLLGLRMGTSLSPAPLYFQKSGSYIPQQPPCQFIGPAPQILKFLEYTATYAATKHLQFFLIMTTQ